MVRLTIRIEERILRRLKQRAAAEGQTLDAVVNGLLRQGLTAPSRRGYKLAIPVWNGVQAEGVDLFSRRALFDWMDASDSG